MKHWTRTAATVLAASILCGSMPIASVSAEAPTGLRTVYSVSAAASEEAFTAKDYSAERGTVTKHVEFKINTAEITADELEEMGYTISEDRTTASKDATLAQITYTFNKLPATLEELKEFSLKSDVQGDYDYGMFAPMAATIIALHTFGTNKEEAYKMLAYAYGPSQTFSNIDKQFVQTQFYTAANKVLQDCYFGGAAPENGYTPDEPFTITLEEGPYFMKASNGKPERHMSMIYFAGADTERYMDVFKSSGGTWYAYESNYKHLLASVKTPTGTAPAETVTTTVVTSTTTKTTATTTSETTTQTTTTAPPEAETAVGDVDGDGKVSVEDAQLTLNAYVNNMAGMGNDLTEQQVKAADVNADGIVSVDDAQNILNYYVLNVLSGSEITWDELLGKNKPTQPRPDLMKLLKRLQNQ